MKANYLNSIINAAISVIEQVLGKEITKDHVSLKKDNLNSSHLSAVIEVRGQNKGAFIISLSEEAAIFIASVMLSEQKRFLDKDVIDCIGEIINMISGGAKGALVEQGLMFKLTPPVFVLGKGTLMFKEDSYAPYITTTFTFANGKSFDIAVSLTDT